MIYNEDLSNRVYNWKFTQALRYLDESKEEKEVVELVKALAQCFGDIGWLFSGDMTIIISAALRNIDK